MNVTVESKKNGTVVQAKPSVKDAPPGEVRVKVRAPNMLVASFELVGTDPYVQHRFWGKADMIQKHREGGKSGKKGDKSPRDFEKQYEQAKHVSTEGWVGIPAGAFRAAMISACRLVGFHMTMAKLTVFSLADGYDREDGTPLIRITGEPEMVIHPVRNDDGSIDMRARPMWREWGCTLRVRYDADQFNHEDVANLVLRVGLQVGVGEGRNDSKKSSGVGWGSFGIAENKKRKAA